MHLVYGIWQASLIALLCSAQVAAPDWDWPWWSQGPPSTSFQPILEGLQSWCLRGREVICVLESWRDKPHHGESGSHDLLLKFGTFCCFLKYAEKYEDAIHDDSFSAFSRCLAHVINVYDYRSRIFKYFKAWTMYTNTRSYPLTFLIICFSEDIKV